MSEKDSRRVYYRTLFGRVRADQRDFQREKSLWENILSGVYGAPISWWLYGAMNHNNFLSWSALFAAVGGGCAGWLLTYLHATIRAAILAPYELDEERKEALAVDRLEGQSAIASLTREHAIEISSLRQQLVAETERCTALRSEAQERYALLEQEYGNFKKMRPQLAVGLLYESNGRLLAPVQNHGGIARRVWARISVSGDLLLPCNNAYATWDRIEDKKSVKWEMTLAKGEKHDIVVAGGGGDKKGSNIFLSYFWIPFIENGEYRETRSLEGSLYGEPNTKARQSVKIEVFSEPRSIAEPISFSLTLVGDSQWEDVQGIDLAPIAVVPPEEEDPWYNFYVAAGECIVQWSSMEEAARFAPDDWDTFREIAVKAYNLALLLPEPFTDAACALVRPLFVGGREDVNASAVNISELRNFKERLQNFLLQQQFGVHEA